MKRISYLALSFAIVFVANCQKKPEPVATTTTAPAPTLSSVYYDYDQSLIRNDMANTLQSNAEYIKSKGGEYSIEGHCDERGSNEYNLALGARRAQSSKNYIVNLGVSSASVKTISYGESRPVCSDSSENCWWKNRRADFRKR